MSKLPCSDTVPSLELPRFIRNLPAGLVNGKQLQAEGVLLDQKLAAVSTVEARSAAYAKLALPSIQDWVMDYSEQPCIWIVTMHAWYR